MTKNIIEKTIEAPAQALDRGIEGGQKIAASMPATGQNSIRRAKSYWYLLGPGLTTGASDDDPSGIATYSQTGAQYGFGQLWTALYMLPFMIAVQEACARIGIIKGKGIAAVVKDHYS